MPLRHFAHLDATARSQGCQGPVGPRGDRPRRQTTWAGRTTVPGRLTAVALTILVLGARPGPAEARPEGANLLCATYPDAAVCMGGVAECATCHVSTWPPTWNAYGLQVLGALGGQPFADALPDALIAVEALDADEDGVSNIDELRVGTLPGDGDMSWPYCIDDAPRRGAADMAADYDFVRAYRRVSVLYCGHSPSYEELQQFDHGNPGHMARHEVLHELLDRCLDSAYWRDEGLARIADTRIRPLYAVGANSPVAIYIGDYEWDYRLFSYVMTGDRDVRDLLLADYHVDVRDDGTLEPITGLVPPIRGMPSYGASGQPLDPAYRAGMITTQWFLASNTMFSPVPRTTAAQAYRAYLGADIAKQQGLWPVASEPSDLDNKGVSAPDCALCHSTLDPLSYAFAYYEGIAARDSGTYQPDRPSQLMSDWGDTQSYLFGQPVASVRAWAEVAVESEAFKRNLGLTMFRHAFEREPTPGEQPAFVAIWQALPDYGWSINRLIHSLIDLPAFGGAQ